MKRREFIGCAAAALPAQQQRRPNILFVLADDWMWPHASISGEPVVKTPTFDRLAKDGVLFTNAHVSAPSCTPSRAAMLTGQWHWRLGEGANLGGTLPSKFPVYPDLLEAAGYHVGFTGKGWSPGDPEPGGRKRNPAGPRFNSFAAFLEQRKPGTPFCFWLGIIDPHRPYDRGTGMKSGMNATQVRVPPYLPDNNTVREDICDYFFEVQRYDKTAGEAIKLIESELDNTIVVMSGDNGWPFPRSKATCYETGTHVPLAVSWPARVKAGQTVADFVSLTDLAPTFLEAAGVRTPQEMTGRSLLPVMTAGKRARDFVLTGMERHVPSRGEIRGGYPMRTIRTREYHYIRNFLPDRWPSGDPNAKPASAEQWSATTGVGFADIDAGPSKAVVVADRESKYFRYAADKRPARELYDIRKDPYELNNLAAEPKVKSVVDKLDAQLIAELKASGDPRATGGGDEFDHYIWYQGKGRNPTL